MILSHPFTLLYLGLAAISTACLLSTTADAAQIQKPGLTQSAKSKQRADDIKSAFSSSYNAYRSFAFGFDELRPQSKVGATSYGGWGATIVDALSTAHVMGLDDIFQEGTNYVKGVDFSKSITKDVSLFETNIRYLGGILSAYELGGKKDKKLVKQAIVIGDHLLSGWVDGNDLPYNSLINWNTTGRPDTTKDASIAEAGTLIIEFDRLSRFSGDKKYLEHAERAMRAILNAPAVFPGLPGQNLDPKDNSPTSDYVTWGGGSDSYFEYLIKYAYLLGEDTGPWIPAWINAVKSSIRSLITRAEGTSANLTYLTDYSASNGGVLPRFSHLGCFAPGNWIFGAKMLGIPDFNDYGLALAESCINTYTSSPSGIGPESFVFVGSGGNRQGITINDADFYRKHGFDFEVVQYILRPEVLESVFYAYRTTGDERWQELAWTAWQAIKKHCKAPAAYAALVNVNSTSPKQYDNSQSFFYAETLKYLYLTFADPNDINLDEYVFTTEAHLFKIDVPAKSYHSEWGRISEPEQLQKGAAGHGPNDGKANGGKKPTATKPSSDDESKSKSKSKVPVPKFSSLPDAKKMQDQTLGSLLEVFGDLSKQFGGGDAAAANDELQRRGHADKRKHRQSHFHG
ncbi:related to Mannosyl-oligosaccharide alpha-1,2-mannosidase precursor [Pseudozyma flocculosa]|uniref:alpha-1,2-Mannosidase n=2 Tax=Pseudozyma flocculosa TaxID=84751 RepID=A0A5C3EWD5_9BASI|nr:related to Mannosyl-oligosaccharide alpha-1,2-mannosidase precursor [Pseudozyma flocculosa]